MALVITRNLTSPAMQRAIHRASLNTAAGCTPIRLDDGSYLVPSATDAEQVYHVVINNLTTMDATCDCKHGQTGDAVGICWHIVAACSDAVIRKGGKVKVKTPRRALSLAAGFAK